MHNSIRANVILADFVQVSDGKLTAVGAGWNVTGPGPVTFGVGIIIDWSWTEAGSHHDLNVELVDEDGHLFELPGPDGADVPLQFSQSVPLVAARGVEKGSRLVQSFAVNFAGLPLHAGSRYEVRVRIDGEADAEWFAAFTTRS